MSTSIPSYCAQQLQEHDRERFACIQFVPSAFRENVYALYAFNLEVARIPEMASEAIVGHIRFAWWREALDEIYVGKAVREHQVVKALHNVIAAQGLPKALFDCYLSAREAAFADQGCHTLDDFVRYGEETEGVLLRLAMMAMDISEIQMNDGVEALGASYALMGHLRAVDFYRRHGWVWLPEEMLAEHELEKTEVIEAYRCPMALQMMARRIAEVAMSRLETSESFPNVARRFARAHKIWVQHTHKRLKQCQYDVFDRRLQAGRNRLMLRLLWLSMR